MWSKEQIKNRTKEYKSIANKTQTQYLKFIKSKGERFPSPTTIRRYFGSWNDFKIEVYGAKSKLHRKNIGLNSIREIVQEEIKKQLEGMDMSRQPFWTKTKCEKALGNYPKIEYMTKLEYDSWRRENDLPLPSKNVVAKKFNGWNNMKQQVFDTKNEKLSRINISQFCKECLYFEKCEYNYDLKKCKWYEEGIK